MILSKSLYANVLDNVGDHICLLDKQGNILYTNQAWDCFSEKNGLTECNWSGQNYLQACRDAYEQGDSSAQMALLGIEQVIQGERAIFYLEYPCHSVDESRWFLLTAKIIHQQDAQLVYVSHQQLQAQSELKLVQERLSLATKAGNIGVWDLDLKTNKLIWDDLMYQIYGLNKDKFSGVYSEWRKSLHPDDIVVAENAFMEAVANVHSFDTEFRIIRPDGETRHIAAKANLLRDELNIPARMVGINIDVTEKRMQTVSFKTMAYQDQLSGFENRNALRNFFQSRNRTYSHCGLVLIDIDNFRSINDAFGHQFGDKMLIALADYIKQVLAGSGYAYRIGADEFLLQLSGNDKTALLTKMGQVYREVQARVVELGWFSVNGGLAVMPIDGLTVSNALQKVDFALKECEVTQQALVVYNGDIEHKYSYECQLAKALKTAVSEQQLEVYFQPQVHEGLGVTGAEALLRWHHPELGCISPADFIPIAEKTGDIVEIGYWVLKEVCQIMHAWLKNEWLSQLVISVNVSPRQIYSVDVFEQMLAIIDNQNIPHSKIKLEVTEGVFLKNAETAVSVMKRFETEGIRFSLDDFGTGFSSLSYVKELPLESLKLDKSFVDDIVDNHSQAAVARAVVALCRGLGMGLLAEGVEESEQYEALKKLGCFACQGYMVSKPLPRMAFESWVLDHEKGESDVNSIYS